MVSRNGRPAQSKSSGGLYKLAMALKADKASPGKRHRPSSYRYTPCHGMSIGCDRDPLTGYMSRIGLATALESKQRKSRQPCAFLLTGINRLAMVNEAYGIDVADELIVATARRLKGALRKSDILGRYAGNKFGIILHDCDEERMRETAGRLLATIGDRAVEVEAGVIPVAISLGGAVVGRKPNAAREAMLQAEEALSHARTRYIGGFQIYRPSELRETERRRNIKLSDEIRSEEHTSELQSH